MSLAIRGDNCRRAVPLANFCGRLEDRRDQMLVARIGRIAGLREIRAQRVAGSIDRVALHTTNVDLMEQDRTTASVTGLSGGLRQSGRGFSGELLFQCLAESGACDKGKEDSSKSGHQAGH